MLIVVRIAGDSANGAARWIGIGSFRFQPTELSKIILIVFFAKFFMDHEETLNTLKTLALSGVLLAVPLFLILEQPDLKNTITVVVIFCIMIYIAGLSYKIIGGALLIAVPLTIIFLSIVVQPDQKLLKDYQRSRIMSFLYPENEEYSDDIEQQNNSKTAIASGELVGKKLSGDNSTTSVNQGNFVAENQTDFIFAVAGEEYGVILLFNIITVLFILRIQKCHDTFSLIVFDQFLIRLYHDRYKNNCQWNNDQKHSSDDLITEPCNINQDAKYSQKHKCVFHIRLFINQKQRNCQKNH